MSNNCDLDFKENCMTRTPSSCVDYEGKMSQCSELTDECKRYSVHETIGDINKQLTTICQDLDMSGVDMGCVVFEGEELRLRDVLDKVIQKLCETKEGDCELIMNTPIDCANLDYGCLTDECGDAVIPSNLKELLQFLINQICYNNPDVPPHNVVVEGGNNTTVDTNTVDNTTTYTVNYTGASEKEYFYEEFISDIQINENAPAPGPNNWFFPIGYEILTYKNTRASNMTVEVHISYEEENSVGATPPKSIYNKVSSAIVKTSGGNDTLEYIKQGGDFIKTEVYNKTTGQPAVNNGDYIALTPSGDEAEIIFSPSVLKQNTSYFKVLTLAPNEEVSLKFMTKSNDGESRLKKAQILVKEL